MADGTCGKEGIFHGKNVTVLWNLTLCFYIIFEWNDTRLFIFDDRTYVVYHIYLTKRDWTNLILVFQSIYNGGDGETSLNFQTENVTDTSTTTYHKNYMKRKSKERCVRFDDRKMCQLYNKVVILFKNINTIDLYGKYIVWV